MKGKKWEVSVRFLCVLWVACEVFYFVGSASGCNNFFITAECIQTTLEKIQHLLYKCICEIYNRT